MMNNLMQNLKLTNLYKTILQKNELVDSGDLYQSVIVDTSLLDNVLTINIKSLDYLKYLVKDNNLTNQFTSNKKFDDEVTNIFFEYIEKTISDILEGKTETVKEPQILIKYNGV